MCFSIPQQINPVFTLPPSGAVSSPLTVGSSVKDLPLHKLQNPNSKLLDRVALIAENKRPAFYAKCLQLIDALAQIMAEKSRYESIVQGEFNKLDRELGDWKNKQVADLRSTTNWIDLNSEYAVQELRRSSRERSSDRENGFFSIGRSYGLREAKNNDWHMATQQAIKAAFQQARENLENQFAAAIKAATVV